MAENTEGTAKPVRGRPFAPGVSGNPGGRPKGHGLLRDLAAAHTEEALAVLVASMRTSMNERLRLMAAMAVLDRAHGRPALVDTAAYITSELEAVLDRLETGLPEELYHRVVQLVAGEEREPRDRGARDG